jgi:hypothetical protein
MGYVGILGKDLLSLIESSSSSSSPAGSAQKMKNETPLRLGSQRSPSVISAPHILQPP